MMDVLGKHVLVVGLARSGRAVARCLRRHGAVVTVTDLKPPAEFQAVIPELVQDKIGMELGSQRQETFLRQELIVVSPGVPWDLPQLAAARDARIPVLPEVEVASWFVQGTLTGVTGTNGKTTTTTLLGKMLEASGYRTFVGGNIGVPLSLAADEFDADSMLVTELSSFQLEGILDLRPHVAVMLNLTPNHLDRHPSFEAYVQAKRQIFRNQQADDFAILNADDPAVAVLAPALPSHPIFFSRHQALPEGVFVADGRVLYRTGHLGRPLFETREVNLRGAFNLEDVLAATAAACTLGADFDAIRQAVREFRGVEHRLEFVRTIEGIEFYNNSKATSVDAAVKSLEAFESGVHLILGGKDKGAPYAPLRPLVKSRTREVLVIGAAGERIARELAGAAEIVRAGDLETAVREAYQRAQPGDVVLLAPACSSFDQFQDYEQRGRVFKEIVHRLAEEVSSGKSAWAAMLEARRRAREAAARPAEPPPAAPPTMEGALPEPSVEPIVEPEAAGGAEPLEVETAPTEEEIQPVAQPQAAAASPAAEPVEAVETTPAIIESSPEPAATVTEGAASADHSAEATTPAEAAPAPPAKVTDVEPIAENTTMEEDKTEGAPAAETERAVEGVAAQPVVEPAPEEPSTDVKPAAEAAPEPEPTAKTPEPDEGASREQALAEPGKRLELEYVYEVAAEELPPPEADHVPSYEDEPQVIVSETEAAPAAVEDELLPFEFRAVGATAGAALGSASQPGSAARSNGKRSGGRQEKPGQHKLPGME